MLLLWLLLWLLLFLLWSRPAEHVVVLLQHESKLLQGVVSECVCNISMRVWTCVDVKVTRVCVLRVWFRGTCALLRDISCELHNVRKHETDSYRHQEDWNSPQIGQNQVAQIADPQHLLIFSKVSASWAPNSFCHIDATPRQATGSKMRG